MDQLRAGGILNPEIVIEEAKREGLRLSLACALLQQESGGGHNVFGHDAGTIFAGAGTVTREKYADYKRQRDANPKRRRMQGVGARSSPGGSCRTRRTRKAGAGSRAATCGSASATSSR